MNIFLRLIYVTLITFIWALPVTLVVNFFFRWRGAVADKVTELLFIPFLLSIAGMMFWIYFNLENEQDYAKFALASIGTIVFFATAVVLPAVS